MLKKRWTLALCVLTSANALAQGAGSTPATPPPQTTEGCEARAEAIMEKTNGVMQDSVSRDRSYKVNTKELSLIWNREFAACVRTLPLATMPAPSMTRLAHFYAQEAQHTEARTIVEQLLRRRGVSESVKADALADIVLVYLVHKPSLTEQAAQYLAQFNALSDSVVKRKVSLHAELNEFYRDQDSDRGLRVHARALIDLGKRLYARGIDSGTVRAKAAGLTPGMLLSAYGNYADVLGDEGRPDLALKVLADAVKEHPEFTAKETEIVRTSLERFRMVGTAAPAIEADHWFNAPAGTRRQTPGGEITVVGFGAHWCPPCIASYPYLVALHEKYASMGVRFLYSTEYYGYIGRKGHLSTDEETEATRDYYVNQHHIPFPIAMAGQSPDSVTTFGDMPHTNFVNYKVTWIPVWYVIDRKGIIRQVLTSWEPDQAIRLSGMLDALIKER